MKNNMSKSLIISIIILFTGSQAYSQQIDKNKFFIKEWNYVSFSLEKLLGLSDETDNLQLVDSCDYIYIKERQWCSSSEYYYYAIIDTTNYYSYVYFYFKDYVKSFVLVNYDKEGKYIDDITISSMSGDGGYFSSTDGRFAYDSIIIQTETEEEVVEGTPEASIFEPIIISLIRYKIVLKEDGHIQEEILRQYLPCK